MCWTARWFISRLKLVKYHWWSLRKSTFECVESAAAVAQVYSQSVDWQLTHILHKPVQFNWPGYGSCHSRRQAARVADSRRGPSDWSWGPMQAKVRQIFNDVLWGFMDFPYLRWMGCRNKLSLRQHKPLGATCKCPHFPPSRADKNGPVALPSSRSHFTAACLAHTIINPFITRMFWKCLQMHGQCWVSPFNGVQIYK